MWLLNSTSYRAFGWPSWSSVRNSSGLAQTLRQRIEALALATETGRTNTGAALPAVGNLPAGWTVVGNRASGDTSPVIFDNLDFMDQGGENLDIYSNSTVDVSVRQSVFGELNTPSGGFSYVQPRGAGSNVLIENCTFHGFDGAGGADNLLARFHEGGNYTIRRSRFLNTSFDAIKSSDGVVQECYIGPANNTSAVPLAWNVETSYALRDVVYGTGADSSRMYIALQASTGESIPSGEGSNAYWGWYDPHTDMINPAAGDTYIGYTLIETPDNGDTLYGPAQIDRSVRNSDSGAYVGVALREGIVSQPWVGFYPYFFDRQNPYSSGRAYSTGDYTQKGVRLFRSLTDSNVGNDPFTEFADWEEVLYDNFEGPYVMRHSWIGSGTGGDYFFPKAVTAATPEANREPHTAIVIDNVVDYDTGNTIDMPAYCCVENTPEPTFGVRSTYTPAAWSDEGNSWLIEATGEGQFHTEGGTVIDACVIQIGSSVVAYIEDGQAPTLIPSAYHWTVTNAGSGVYRFECNSLAGSRMTARARTLAGTATITAETISSAADPVTFDQTAYEDNASATGGTASPTVILTAGKYIIGVGARSGGGVAEAISDLVLAGQTVVPFTSGDSSAQNNTRSSMGLVEVTLASDYTGTLLTPDENRRWHIFGLWDITGWDRVSGQSGVIIDPVNRDVTFSGVQDGDTAIVLSVSRNNNPVYGTPISEDFADPSPSGSKSYGGGHGVFTADAASVTVTVGGLSQWDGPLTGYTLLRAA